MSQERSLPRSPESERAVLGGLMLDASHLAALADTIAPEDFYREAHQHLYRLMLVATEQGDPIDMVALCQRIVNTGRADDMGGIAYVSGLPDNVPSPETIPYHARQVRDCADRRRVIEAAEKAIEAAHSGAPASEVVETATAALSGIGAAQGGAWSGMAEMLTAEVERIDHASRHRGEVSGVPTGLVDLDRFLGGLQPSDLVVLAARPAMGKTCAATGISRGVAGAGRAVGFFSLEMSKGQLVSRLICAEAQVDAGKLRSGFLSDREDWPAIHAAHERLAALPLFIDDTPGLTVGQIKARTMKLKAANPSLSLVVVDYIGLMGASDPRAPREQQVSAASRGLKALAKELGITVIVLSQLNRGVEDRNPKVPQLSDLRESGAIEQDADIVLFIYRESYYVKESARQGEADILIAKHRQGATGEVAVAFEGRFTRFSNLAKDSRGGW
jgi:replicative DNA helicase